jgi:potassium channel subfamily K, other eukaryote
VSLIAALVANLALLLNMARRIPFGIAQSITIIGWYVAGFLLITLVAVANSRSSGFQVQPYDRHGLSQAFYYAILAAILYLVIASLMVFTVFGAYRGHYDKNFSLTTAQRTLMLQTIIFMMYLLLGALVFKHIENWQYEDAVFWANFTLLTIGLGSPFTPNSHLGRSLLFPYAIGGILTVGLVIGSIRSLVLERGKRKLKARFVEKKREQTVNSIDTKNRTIRVSLFQKYDFSEEGLSETQRREQEFNVMRKIQNKAHNRERYMSLTISTSATLILWLVGAAVFAVCERPQGWTYFTGLYFSYVSLLTIGYGDIQPASNSGKPFFVLWTLMAIPTLTIFISHLGDTVIKSFADLAIWAGSVTILPDDSGIKKNLKGIVRIISRGGKLNLRELRFEKPPGFIPYSDDNEEDKDLQSQLREHALDRLANHLKDEELEEAMEAEQSGDDYMRDIHIYHYVLVRELKTAVTDMLSNPDRRYSYRDWAWFLKLLGQDEGDDLTHRLPPKTLSAREDIKDELGNADGRKRREWSWLGIRSPLMSSKTEPEWLTERLGAALENEMKKLRKGERGDKPPISIRDLSQRRKEEHKSNSVTSNQNDQESDADNELDANLAKVKKSQ